MSGSLCKTCSITYGVSVTQCKYKLSGVEREMKDTIWPKSSFYAATRTRTEPPKEEEETKTSGFHPQSKISVRTEMHVRNGDVLHHVALFEVTEILLIFLDTCLYPNFILMISFTIIECWLLSKHNIPVRFSELGLYPNLALSDEAMWILLILVMFWNILWTCAFTKLRLYSIAAATLPRP